MKKNKICVYTCITGDYDKIKELEIKEAGIDYYFFTNNKELKSSTWNVIYIDNDGLDNIRFARKIKVLGHDILKDYDVTIWLDGASYIRKSAKEFLDRYCDLEKYSLIGFKHNYRDCIYDEAVECIKVRKDKKLVVKKQMDLYQKNKYPKHNGLIESTVLIRNFKNKKLNKVMKNWFSEIKKCSYRDQLSFNYVAWKNKFDFKLLDMNVFDNEYFGWEKHKVTGNRNLDNFYVYFGKDTEFSYGHFLEGKYKKENDSYILEFKTLRKCTEFKVEFAIFSGILFDNLKINVDNLESSNLVNYRKYFEYQIFDESIPTVFLYGDFSKNQLVRLEIKMQILDDEFYLKLLKRFNLALITVVNSSKENRIFPKIKNFFKKNK